MFSQFFSWCLNLHIQHFAHQKVLLRDSLENLEVSPLRVPSASDSLEHGDISLSGFDPPLSRWPSLLVSIYSNEGTDSGSNDVSAVMPKRRPFPSFLSPPSALSSSPYPSLPSSCVASRRSASPRLSLPPSPSLSVSPRRAQKMNEYN